MDERIQKTIDNLKQRQFNALYVEKGSDVLPILEKMMTEGETVANGGSVTLGQLGVVEFLKSGKFNYLSAEGLSDAKEIKDAMRKRFFADSFLCSANAITTDGRIFQEDGASTRVAPMIYGPDKVFIVAGVNKIVDTQGQAMARIKQVAPANCKRRGFKTPCAEDGVCHDCRVSGRSCCTSVTLNYSRIPDRITVIIVNEDLGV